MGRKLSRSKRKQIVQASRKAAAHAGAQSKATAGKLRIQTVALWKRVVLIGLGLFFLGLAISLRSHSVGLTIFLLISALFLIVLGGFGKRKSIDDVLNGIDSAITEKIWDSIF